VSDILDAVTPYASTRDHLLDEIAAIRARALAHVGGNKSEGAPQGDAPPPGAPDPLVIARRVQLSLAAGVELRMVEIENAFALSPIERAVLLTTLAAEVDPLFRAVCRGLQGELAGPTLQVGTIVELVTDELDAAVDSALLFLPEEKLRANALVSVEDKAPRREVPMQALRVKIDRNLALYLLGARASSAPSWITHVIPEKVLGHARIPADRKQDLVTYLAAARTAGRRLLVELHGPPGAGKKHLAEGLCAELGRPLLVVDCRAMKETPEEEELAGQLAHVRRESVLSGGAPYLDAYDAILNRHEAPRNQNDEQSQQVLPSAILTMPNDLLEFLKQAQLCFMSGAERYEPLEQAGEVLRVSLPFPSPAQRAAIWEQTFERIGAPLAEGVDLGEIGRKLALDARRIQSAARAALSTAMLRTHDGAPVLVERADIIEASRHQLQHDLKSLAVRVDKAYRWEDLVISVDGYHALMEMISYAQHAEMVYDKWGFGAKHSVAQGISALFSGPPGTGKTMCASVIARELDMELFRVDLSRVVSKWIGETEKNLARVFDEAQRSHAVILFDEADSLFAKRTEVKSSIDRYANLEVNFLLQRMETFDGITILTTNFEDTIDTAFKRRLTFRIRFEKPDADARAALWQKMIPESAEVGDDVDFAELGLKYEVSGGNIRNAAIRAAFLATAEGHKIDMDTLVRATLREAREMGVLVAEPRTSEDATGEGAETPPVETPPRDPKSPPPKLVPITHRR
jgi:SpoVK/Ycf46/Vps4 family AAA+-type ATPase